MSRSRDNQITLAYGRPARPASSLARTAESGGRCYKAPPRLKFRNHHLQLAGRGEDLFSDDAISQIHEAARGKARAGKNPAIAALIASYAAAKKIVDQSAARAAISEVISAE